MDFYAVLDQVIALLRSRGRVSYRALKRQFGLDDDYLNDLKVELIAVHQVAVDQDGTMLVWSGAADTPAVAPPLPSEAAPPLLPKDAHVTPSDALPTAPLPPDAERRQLTVLFCDLVDSTRLAGQLDPEEWREVMRAYQATSAVVIQRFDGYIAQYLGDGLLVYFGYPQAHEEDAQRAVRTGLGILEAMGTLATQHTRGPGSRLAVRVGIHTGLVVVGEVGAGDRHEHLALGDTPNIAARLQGLAEADTVVISETTFRLVQGYFTCHDRGRHALKGLDTPLRVYQVVGTSAAQSRLDVAGAAGLTPLVGREAEVALLWERWTQSTGGHGQVVVLSGEAGIGKSRLVRVLTERVVEAHAPQLTLRCSPYHTNSPLYPVIEYCQRSLLWRRDTPPAVKLATLERALQAAHLPLAAAVPLVAVLLGVPVPEHYAPLPLSAQRQKQQTQAMLATWLLAEAAQHAVLMVWEDLHWADPSTLELLGLLIEQVVTTRGLLVLTCRPEFVPPWASRVHLSHLHLTRFTQSQATEMITQVTGGKALPAVVVEQIVTKTDGVPLFVEELVKTILDVGLVREEADRYVLIGPLPPLAIPTTLQDALMARLDRLAPVKGVAQLGATLGREFSYEVLQAVAAMEEPVLQQSLAQLVAAELLYQQGVPPHATYTFKHALIQEAAYQSLLRSTRQQVHQRIAQVLEAQFPETVAIHPELLAHHLTEAGCHAQAVGYWQRAGEGAVARSAHLEAISHLTKGLEVLQTLPEAAERIQQELVLQTTLGPALMLTKGFAAPEVEHAYARARALCQRVGETPQLFSVLRGLWQFYNGRGAYQTARELGEQCLQLAQQGHDTARLVEAHHTLWTTRLLLGELPLARAHLEQGMALYDPQQHRSLAFLYGHDPGVCCRSVAALALWLLGYPTQALRQQYAAHTLAQELAHPPSLAFTRMLAAIAHHLRREAHAAHGQAEALMALATEQEFALFVAMAMILRGGALTALGQRGEQISQIRQGMAAVRATGTALWEPYFLALLAEAYGQEGQIEAGLAALAEALATAHATGERWGEAELYRLRGELLLLPPCHDAHQAETCFQQALAVSRQQQAKSWELRAAVSLARLWQQQGKQNEARALLMPVYGWFIEGLDTADLREAGALLDALGA
jgi:class 3 adenylate cyclase/predicted ATPase